MADDQHEPQTSPAADPAAPDGAEQPSADAAPAAAEPVASTDPAAPTASTDPVAPDEEVVEVVEAELVETETIVESPDPAAQASESLAAAAAAASAADPAPTEPAEWPAAAPAEPAPQYVVVEAPQAPIERGNRGIGALLALAGAIIYGGVLVGVGYLLEYLAGRPGVGFLQDWHFYLPVILFAVVFVLLVLLVNRAGWWSYILGSLVVGLAVYFGTAAGDALIDEWTRAAQPHTISAGLQAPFVILAAIIAREVAVWWGSLIALRGRRVTARNRAAREAYDEDLAEFRARYGG